MFPTEENQIDEEEKNLLEKFFAEDDDNAVSGNYKVDEKELGKLCTDDDIKNCDAKTSKKLRQPELKELQQSHKARLYELIQF